MLVVVSSPNAGLLTIRISQATLVERRGKEGKMEEEEEKKEEDEEEVEERHGTQKS